MMDKIADYCLIYFFLFLVIIMYNDRIDNDSSIKIEFYKNSFNVTVVNDTIYTTNGIYNTQSNTIKINVNADDDVLGIIYHEYSHSLFDECLSEDDKTHFIPNLNNEKLIYYNETEYKREAFAYEFTDFLQHRKYFDFNGYNIFMDYVYEKCIK